MATIEKFEDILAWQKGRDLTKAVYEYSSRGPFSRDFALRDQIRRAAISITSNIAEGFERDGNRELIQFLSHSKGSCGEVRSQLYVALDQNYLTQAEHQDLENLCLETSRLINGFSQYLQNSKIKGRKYQNRDAALQLET